MYDVTNIPGQANLGTLPSRQRRSLVTNQSEVVVRKRV